MPNYIPRFKPGQDITYLAVGAVSAGQVVEVVGDYAASVTTAASAKVAGVALFDAADGDFFTVSSGGVQRPTTSVALAAGDSVTSDAAGKVTKTTGATNVLGVCQKAAAANAPADIKFNV